MAPSAIALCRDELAGHVAPAARAAGRSDPVSAETLVPVAHLHDARVANHASNVRFVQRRRRRPVGTVDRMTEHARTANVWPARPRGSLDHGTTSTSAASMWAATSLKDHR